MRAAQFLILGRATGHTLPYSRHSSFPDVGAWASSLEGAMAFGGFHSGRHEHHPRVRRGTSASVANSGRTGPGPSSCPTQRDHRDAPPPTRGRVVYSSQKSVAREGNTPQRFGRFCGRVQPLDNSRRSVPRANARRPRLTADSRRLTLGLPSPMLAPMKKRILILDGSIDRSVYRPVEQWARHLDGVAFDAVHLPSNEPVPPLAQYTHVLLTGSEASFSRPKAWFDVEADTVRDAVGRGLAVFGSCFGHQMLVWALSGPEYVRRAPQPELGWVAVRIVRSDPLLADVPNPWHTFASHLDEAITPPEPWRILAANDACDVQAIRYDDRPVWGIQPHPETPPDQARLLMESAIDKYPDYVEQIRRALESPVRDDRVTPQLIDVFLRG